MRAAPARCLDAAEEGVKAGGESLVAVVGPDVFAEDGQGTSTNACIVAHPAARILRACRGAADRGAWVTLGFGG